MKIEELVVELRRVDKLLSVAKEEHERMFIYMRFAELGKALNDRAMGHYTQSVKKCMARLEPVVKTS